MTNAKYIVAQKIYTELRDKILNFEIQPNFRLTETELAPISRSAEP